MKDHLKQFCLVRSLQSEQHSCGLPILEAFMSGRCHIMALALHEANGGDIVVITPKEDPNYLIHAGVYRDGKVVDAQGYNSAHDWSGMWRTKSYEFNGDFRRVNRAELISMMPNKECTKQEISEAMPLAIALIKAGNLDIRVWESPPPAKSYSHIVESEPDSEIFIKAMSAEPKTFIYQKPSPSRAEIQENARHMNSIQR